MPTSFNFRSLHLIPIALITSWTTYLFHEIFHWIAILVVGCLGYMVLIQSPKNNDLPRERFFLFGIDLYLFV
ncbi:MAG: hypothetical protein VW080_11600 [Flavobacteriaceae bacterium]